MKDPRFSAKVAESCWVMSDLVDILNELNLNN